MTKEMTLQANTRTVFLGIATGDFSPATCPVKGPHFAAAIGALKKKELIVKSGADYLLTAAGAALYDKMMPKPEPAVEEPAGQEPATEEPAAEATEPKAERKAKAEAKPRHNERTMGYVHSIRNAFGCRVSELTDEQIAQHVWRVASLDRALVKAAEIARPE